MAITSLSQAIKVPIITENISIPPFEHIVASYADNVYNVCLGMMKNEQDAEDLAQEVFISAYTHYQSFNGQSQIITWLYRIAVNKCLEAMRKGQRQKRKVAAVSLTEANEQGGDRFYHPGVEIERRERSAILFAAMDKLPETQRVAFTLQQVEGLSQAQIAIVMEKSESSIESLLHRAKTNLRKTLKAYYEEH
ncbi:MAG: RNA polymerase sigma factor [Bacteroidota bacterium]